MHARNTARIASTLLVLSLASCGWQSSDTVEAQDTDPPAKLTARHGVTVYEGCTIDSYAQQTLQLASARKVLQDVVLLCLAAHPDGTVHLREADETEVTAARVADQITALHALGYHALLGFVMRDENGDDYDALTNGAALATRVIQDSAWRGSVLDAVHSLALSPDGYEIALPTLMNTAQPSVTTFVTSFSQAFRSASVQLGIFVPPSLTQPSDVDGGDAYNPRALSTLVDQVRVETLEFSCCDTPGGGPTTDAGWAVDAARFALVFAPGRVSVSVPLYGTDFGSHIKYTNWDEATSRANENHIAIERNASSTPHYAYVANGETRYVWYDDALSTERMLYAWEPPVLDADVGLVFWGLGAEDPALWNELAARYP